MTANNLKKRIISKLEVKGPNLIKGCQSNVWLSSYFKNSNAIFLVVVVPSESTRVLISRG